jgi:hypothetical protein
MTTDTTKDKQKRPFGNFREDTRVRNEKNWIQIQKKRMVWKNEAFFGSLHNGNVYCISEYINFKMAFFFPN